MKKVKLWKENTKRLWSRNSSHSASIVNNIDRLRLLYFILLCNFPQSKTQHFQNKWNASTSRLTTVQYIVDEFSGTLCHRAAGPLGRRGPWAAGRWAFGPPGHRAVAGRGLRAAGPSGRRGPWAAGGWAAGLLLAKPPLCEYQSTKSNYVKQK